MTLFIVGKTAVDETWFLAHPIAAGDENVVVAKKSQPGGMVVWAGRALSDDDNPPNLVFLGQYTGEQHPCHQWGDVSQTRPRPQNKIVHVLVEPNGQRTFFSPTATLQPEKLGWEDFVFPPPPSLPPPLEPYIALICGYSLAVTEPPATLAQVGAACNLTVVALPTVRRLARYVENFVLLPETMGSVPLVFTGSEEETSALKRAWRYRKSGYANTVTAVTTAGAGRGHVTVETLTVTDTPLAIADVPIILSDHVDTTGAGDSFAAGVAGFFHRNFPQRVPFSETEWVGAVFAGHEKSKKHLVRKGTNDPNGNDF